jgi:hypothetical protein
MYLYGGRDDAVRATKDNLSSNDLDKRLRVMIKVPREVHSHVCNVDIYTEGVGPLVIILSALIVTFFTKACCPNTYSLLFFS